MRRFRAYLVVQPIPAAGGIGLMTSGVFVLVVLVVLVGLLRVPPIVLYMIGMWLPWMAMIIVGTIDLLVRYERARSVARGRDLRPSL